MKKPGFLFMIVIAVLAFSPVEIYAQDKPASSAHKLFAGTGYGSDLVYDGSVQSFNQPYFSADLYYVYKSRLWASVVAYNLPGQASFIPMADFSVGYNYVLDDNFDFSVSLSNYRTSAHIKQTIHDNFSYLRLKGGFDWYYLYTTLSLGTLFAETNDWYIYLRNSKFFRTDDLGSKEAYISFDPSLSLVFGTSSWYETIVVDSPGKIPGKPGGSGNTTQTEVARTAMDFVKMELSVPVSFNIRKFSLEADAVYLIPRKQAYGIERKEGLYFFMSAYVRVF
jgi:hypothetical protein